MNPDLYDISGEWTSPETEIEITLGGEDFLVIGVVKEETRLVIDATRPSGIRTVRMVYLDEVHVYPAMGDTYSDDALTGEALEAWKSAHGANVAERIYSANEADE
jgi:hypothetical protein